MYGLIGKNTERKDRNPKAQDTPASSKLYRVYRLFFTTKLELGVFMVSVNTSSTVFNKSDIYRQATTHIQIVFL